VLALSGAVNGGVVVNSPSASLVTMDNKINAMQHKITDHTQFSLVLFARK